VSFVPVAFAAGRRSHPTLVLIAEQIRNRPPRRHRSA
jgi:hypothetical protein